MKTNRTFKTALLSLTAFAGIGLASIGTFGIAHAADYTATPAVTQSVATSGAFVQKSKTLKGNWKIIEVNGQTVIRFGDDFKAKRGPDLKIFLSPQTLTDVTGKTATDGAVLLGELKNTKGTQDYVIPAGINPAAFSSVLVHCEAYSVLWGGGAL